MAGPWFTVLRRGEKWQKLGQVWISNGTSDGRGQIEIRIELAHGPAVKTETSARTETTANVDLRSNRDAADGQLADQTIPEATNARNK